MEAERRREQADCGAPSPRPAGYPGVCTGSTAWAGSPTLPPRRPCSNATWSERADGLTGSGTTTGVTHEHRPRDMEQVVGNQVAGWHPLC